jgi:hypothetical protein
MAAALQIAGRVQSTWQQRCVEQRGGAGVDERRERAEVQTCNGGSAACVFEIEVTLCVTLVQAKVCWVSGVLDLLSGPKKADQSWSPIHTPQSQNW